ncbi:hypothetical protein SH611_06140 [Geminicoccaceae bacterium 1502E]|nr:hypothetical protein [Geminicoccaceae bacterium 1502E]
MATDDDVPAGSGSGLLAHLGEREQARYGALLQALLDWYEPVGPEEADCVHAMAFVLLQERHIRSVERRLLEARPQGGRATRSALSTTRRFRAGLDTSWRAARERLEESRARRLAPPRRAALPEEGASARRPAAPRLRVVAGKS